MTDQYINMDNLAVGYNGKALIHDICIGIEKGEIVTPQWCRQVHNSEKYHTSVKAYFWKCDNCRGKSDKTFVPRFVY